MSIKTRDDPHWYDLAGNPRHSAGLREARKENLLPSVTTVLGVWPKQILETYKIEQAIKACFEVTRGLDETMECYIQRIYDHSTEHRKATAAFGKRIHSACEYVNLNNGEVPVLEKDIERHVLAYRDWYLKNVKTVFSAETVAVNSLLGFAGTYDLAAEILDIDNVFIPSIADIKTQNWKDKPRPNIYDTWQFQLAAYAKTLNDYIPGLIRGGVSIVINSDPNAADDRLLYVHRWDWAHYPTALRKFMACLALWRENKNFYYGSNL